MGSRIFDTITRISKIRKNTRLLKEGDIIVIFSHEVKRNRWKFGKVVKLICGSDDIPRAAILRVNNNDKMNYIKRPVTKLYPLEINGNFDITEIEKVGIPDTFSDDNETANSGTSERPTRIFADTGVLIRRLMGQS